MPGLEEWSSSDRSRGASRWRGGRNRIRLTGRLQRSPSRDHGFYLVTGGAGFIGSHLVEELLRRGHRVRIVDSFITGNQANLEAVRSRHDPDGSAAPELVIGDLADPRSRARPCRAWTIVLHQAAIPSVPRSVDDPVTSNRANVDATLQLLVAARDAGVKRVVYAGSSSAYGDTPTLPKHEDMPANPLSPYALQKFVGEQYMQLFTRLYGLETVTIRYFNVFGPRQDPSSRVLRRDLAVPQSRWSKARRPTIHGDGEQTRDFTYVANVVDGVLRAVESPRRGRRSDQRRHRSRASRSISCSRSCRSSPARSLQPRYGPARAGDVRDSQADIGKAEQLLGYRPTVPLEEGLRRTLAWFTANSPHSR